MVAALILSMAMSETQQLIIGSVTSSMDNGVDALADHEMKACKSLTYSAHVRGERRSVTSRYSRNCGIRLAVVIIGSFFLLGRMCARARTL